MPQQLKQLVAIALRVDGKGVDDKIKDFRSGLP
jgi:hypothetical protein